jgi:hypothetical protein
MLVHANLRGRYPSILLGDLKGEMPHPRSMNDGEADSFTLHRPPSYLFDSPVDTVEH